jgi:H+/Cl- antiporter ClcA
MFGNKHKKQTAQGRHSNVLNLERSPQMGRGIYRSRIAVIFESILIGLLTGTVVVLFRMILGIGDQTRPKVYAALRTLPWYYTLGVVAAFVVVGLLLGYLAKKLPMIRGSGIPQVEGSLKRLMTLDWAKELPAKLVSGVLGLGAGLSMGREGPSIQIGAYISHGVLFCMRRPHTERRFLTAAGAAAGLAAAFSAPLAGVLFALEELSFNFNPLFIACAMAAAWASDAVTKLAFGMYSVFDFRSITLLPIDTSLYVVALGVICGLLGCLFKFFLYRFQDFYAKTKLPRLVWPVLPLLVCIVLGFTMPYATGGGHGLIEALTSGNWQIGMLIALLAAKMLFTALCYGSGTAGGIFLPLLACGAVTGAAWGNFLTQLQVIPPGFIIEFNILGMTAFFSSVVGAPITGVILLLEMSGNMGQLGSLVLVSITAVTVSQALRSRPVYTVLLERMLPRRT